MSEKLSLKEAYDFKKLLAKIQQKGGPEAEKFAKVNYQALTEWLKESAEESDTQIDDFAMPNLISALDKVVLKALDHIDGQIAN